jgi:hypothetical protein
MAEMPTVRVEISWGNAELFQEALDFILELGKAATIEPLPAVVYPKSNEISHATRVTWSDGTRGQMKIFRRLESL